MGTNFTPKYTTVDNVKVRLSNKVQFQADPSDLQQGELADALLAQIITRAEVKVEQDLRTRYKVPFQSSSEFTWQALPDHTRMALTEAVDLKAVRMVLETEFGRGSSVSADAYIKSAKEDYEEYIKRLLGYDPESSTDEHHKRFRFAPPLDDLMLAPTNSEADDGYRGMIINTDGSCDSAESYAEGQINNPGRSYLKSPNGGILS